MMCRIALLVAAALPLCGSFSARAPAFPRSAAAVAPTVFTRVSRVSLADDAVPDVGVEGGSSSTPSNGFMEKADAIYRFSRPHTIRGTLLACFTGVARALIESPSFLPLLPAMLPRARCSECWPCCWATCSLLASIRYMMSASIRLTSHSCPSPPDGSHRRPPGRSCSGRPGGAGHRQGGILSADFRPLSVRHHHRWTLLGPAVSAQAFPAGCWHHYCNVRVQPDWKTTRSHNTTRAPAVRVYTLAQVGVVRFLLTSLLSRLPMSCASSLQLPWLSPQLRRLLRHA